jgi:hypothetical protein
MAVRLIKIATDIIIKEWAEQQARLQDIGQKRT